MSKVLVVDDERKMRRVLQILLEQMGLESIPAENGGEALEHFAAEKIDLVLTDLRMPDMSGVELLDKIRAVDSEVPIIVFTAYGTVQSAVDAMKRGAFDYILKPFDLEAVEVVIRRAVEMGRYRIENRYLREQAAPAAPGLIGESPALQRIASLISQVAPTRSPVLITGETGTGKEVVARAIHAASPRSERLFVPLNCAAIPAELLEAELFGFVRGAFTGAEADRPGKFEVADHGTLFLDEIGEMTTAMQAKLLRVLQEGIVERIGSNKHVTVDSRIVSSTNRDLDSAMRQGTFREDLFYRINVFHIHLPPLRERREDIQPLARHFLQRFATELGRPPLVLSEEAERLLVSYNWPGNVRELRNAMERAAVLCSGTLIEGSQFRSLAAEPPPPPTVSTEESYELTPAVEDLERKMILRALGAADDNKAQAARLLGISERTLWYKLKRYGL
jgi:two-component system, NtrC family, response regulator AtoC